MEQYAIKDHMGQINEENNLLRKGEVIIIENQKQKNDGVSIKLIEALSDIISYIQTNFTENKHKLIISELMKMLPENICYLNASGKNLSYEELQFHLSSLNEKESIRKINGVYYTSTDVVNYIITNSIKELYVGIGNKMLSPGKLNTINIPESFCYEKIIYDPTCGAGEFLLSALNIKIDLFHHLILKQKNLLKLISTIRGNDINEESIIIAKLRLFLCIITSFGAEMIGGVGDALNSCFTTHDFITMTPDSRMKYDIIVGNPPYVESAKSGIPINQNYGNIYANVLDNASKVLNNGGVMGFIIPLSYISTPRMQKIREKLGTILPKQYILCFSDRPDCLFVSVHQKLCILIGKKALMNPTIFTSNYLYWYKEERKKLFSNISIVKNKFISATHIPKFGDKKDIKIYNKICKNKVSLSEIIGHGDYNMYINMRATFWIKAFLGNHSSGEYKAFMCSGKDEQSFAICLLNSSLFWWFWICTSDCWHLTRKEFDSFKIPTILDFTETRRLSKMLEKKLESTKVYVGTKQTEYEYKHKSCINEIHQIDDYINKLYGLTNEESKYIKDFAYRYRMGEGAKL